MELALYEPLEGYYAASRQTRTGKDGDFFTSVSVGPLFGRLLAHRIHAFWLANGSPDILPIIEAGAHDGSLALDILQGAKDFSQDFRNSLSYTLIEASAELRRQQQSRLSGASHLESIDDLAEDPRPSIFLSNELFDAFPVDCFEMTDGGWRERRVDGGPDSFHWVLSDPKKPLGWISDDYSLRTLVERRKGIADFFDTLASKRPAALFIAIDYGFARPELYHKDRIGGTLSAYRAHRRIDDVLQDPGLLDLTTHIDFTELAECASANGYQPQLFCSQASYFTALSRTLLLQIEQAGSPDPALIRQFQSLTHPGIMGRSFQVFEACSSDLNSRPPLSQEDILRRVALE